VNPLNWLGSLFGGISSAVHDAINWAVSQLKSLLDTVEGYLDGAWTWLANMATAAINAVEDVILSIWSALGYAMSKAWADLSATATYLWKQVESLVATVYTTAARWVEDLAKQVVSVADAIYKWVADHVFSPLWGWVQTLYGWIKNTGETMWGYFKNPLALAGLLLIPLVNVLLSLSDAAIEAIIIPLAKWWLANLTRWISLAEDVLEKIL
jgi:hypothetical protein